MMHRCLNCLGLIKEKATDYMGYTGKICSCTFQRWEEVTTTHSTGWICPVCNRGVAPHVERCSCK